jgi:DNA-binding NarL/FixJ family response regulator
MFKELSNKVIYDDFKNKMVLTDDEIQLLDMLLLKYSMTKISYKMCMSDRNLSRIKKSIKEKYNIYKTLELAKLNVLKS